MMQSIIMQMKYQYRQCKKNYRKYFYKQCRIKQLTAKKRLKQYQSHTTYCIGSHIGSSCWRNTNGSSRYPKYFVFLT